MLRVASQVQPCLWEELLAVGVGVRVLPDDLAAIDVLLGDLGVFEPIAELWRAQDRKLGTAAMTEGRPTIAMETFVRMMVLKTRTGWAMSGWSARSLTRCTCGASV